MCSCVFEKERERKGGRGEKVKDRTSVMMKREVCGLKEKNSFVVEREGCGMYERGDQCSG